VKLWPLVAVGVLALCLSAPALPLCETEDSPSCIWFGPLQGNQTGDIVINGTDSWIVIPLP
jgi:hypothetical protein